MALSTISGVGAGSSGTILTTTSPKTGNVIQVVQATSTSQFSTTSTSFVTTGFSTSITPSFSTSKVLILLSAMVYSNTATAEPQIAIYRGGSTIGTFTDLFSSSSAVIAGNSAMYLDSPATTSSTTYTLYLKQGNTGTGGTVYIGPNGTTYSLILMEIAG
jgi:hypothetical protein